MNSVSTAQTCSNGRSNGVTSGPLLEKRMLGAVYQSALVAERKAEDFCRLEHWPDRIGKPACRRRKHLVDPVLKVGVKPDPLLDAVEQSDFLGPVVFVLVSLGIGMPDRNDAHRTARRHRQVKGVGRDSDANARERLHHFVGHGEERSLHPDLEIDQRDHRTKIRMRPEELVLPRRLADVDRYDADSAGAFDAGEITTKSTKFLLLLVELVLGHDFELGFLDFIGHSWRSPRSKNLPAVWVASQAAGTSLVRCGSGSMPQDVGGAGAKSRARSAPR